MTKITPERLAEIKKRAEAATEGPWKKDQLEVVAYPKNRTSFDVCNISPEPSYDEAFSNTVFIAHSRSDIPDLIEALEEAWEFAKIIQGLKDFHIDPEKPWEAQHYITIDLPHYADVLLGEENKSSNEKTKDDEIPF